MPLICSPEREAGSKTAATSVLLALQWSMRLVQGRLPQQAKVHIGPRDALIDRQYLAYLNAVDSAHCRNCSYGEGLLSCSTEAVSAQPYWCPLNAPPLESASGLPSVLVAEIFRVERDCHYQHARLQEEMPARDPLLRPAADVASHLGP